MKRLILAVLAILCLSASASAFPDLQLYIPGATYETGGDDPETWIVNASSFDLYVVGKADINDVLVSMALEGFGEGDDVSGVSILVNGVAYTNFAWGTPPMATLLTDFGDLSPHSVFPTWFAEFDAGDFGAVGGIGNTVDEPWDPSIDGYLAGSQTIGEYKKFTIQVIGAAGVHFDAYNLAVNPRGLTNIGNFAPYSHDAASHTPPPPPNGSTPEPATMLLFGLGLAGGAVVRRFKK